MRLAAWQVWIGCLGVALLGCGDAGDAVSGGNAGTRGRGSDYDCEHEC
jgi:hypothetical protein